MTKKYDRKDPAFSSTLLLPPTYDVTTRLMSPQQRAALLKKSGIAGVKADVLAEALKLAAIGDDPESLAPILLKTAREIQDDQLGRFAFYPEDYNYLAAALGSMPTRYEDWFYDLGGLHITPGVTTIFADTGAGKTTMADLLVFNLIDAFKGDASKVMRIKYGESGSDLETFLRFSELAEALPEQLPPIIVIDSVRLQTFDMGGASRSLSISNQLFRWLTEIDVFAVGAGVSVVLVMNPLAGEEDKIAQFRGDVESSVMSVINLKDWHSGSFKHRGPANGRTETAFTLPGEIIQHSVSTNLVLDDVTADAATSTVIKAATATTTSTRTTYGRARAKSV